MIFENLLKRDSNAGVAIAVDQETLTVATSRGPVVVRRTDATAYQVGDRVRIGNGQALARLRPKSTVVRI